MGILSDRQIETEIKITPLSKEQISKGVISHGLSSYGYDLRCGYKFKVFTNVWGAEVDPKNFDPKAFVDVKLCLPQCVWSEVPFMNGQFGCLQCDYATRDRAVLQDCDAAVSNYILIPPNSFALAETIEHLEIPRDVLGVCVGKSTYARCGIICNVTPLEPEWRGKVTIEISNTTPLPARIYAGEGIVQVLFFRADGLVCRNSYADKRGKYQDQPGLVLPKVSE